MNTDQMPMPASKMPASKQCGSCGEPIWWLRSDTTGKLAPIEVKVSDNGNIAVTSTIYHIVPPIHRQEAQQKIALHLNHFATCPQSVADAIREWKGYDDA